MEYKRGKPIDNERRESKMKHRKKGGGRLRLAAAWSFCPWATTPPPIFFLAATTTHRQFRYQSPFVPGNTLLLLVDFLLFICMQKHALFSFLQQEI